MFDVIGIGVGVYTLYAAVAGQVWAKAGPGARLVERSASPAYFWTVIAIYAGLAVALVVWF
jgi:hypothetical protein